MQRKGLLRYDSTGDLEERNAVPFNMRRLLCSTAYQMCAVFLCGVRRCFYPAENGTEEAGLSKGRGMEPVSSGFADWQAEVLL